MYKSIILLSIVLTTACVSPSNVAETEMARKLSNQQDDLWLEEIQSDDALNWVRTQNSRSLPRLEQDPDFAPLRKKLLKTLNSPDKLSNFYLRKNEVYDFWQDSKNVRGVIRRASWKSYKAGRPRWQIILDIDKLAKTEKENWVYGGFDIFQGRALLSLSRGGKDAKVHREFDLKTSALLTNGFQLSEGKHRVRWLDINHLLVSIAGPGEETESGYPLRVRLWQRGTDLDKAPILFTGNKKDVSVAPVTYRDDYDEATRHVFFYQGLDFFNSKLYLWRENKLTELPLPTDAEPSFYKNDVYFTLQKKWHFNRKTFSAGSLLKIALDDLVAKNTTPKVVFAPTKNTVLSSYRVVQNRVFLGTLQDVNSQWSEAILDEHGRYQMLPLSLPERSTISATSYSESSGELIFQSENFLNPPTRFVYDLKTNKLHQLEKSKERFSSSNLKIEQFFATSKDGTRIPYYQVSSKIIKLDGTNPTLLNAYGGFLVNRTPFYSYALGQSWLEKGGVYVLANIRGGGEYGPQWHQSALKENRQRAFDDFFAVAEDLVQRRITSPNRLGIFGGSNGGLLMGVAMTQRPDLFNAIAIQVPLLDMLRYQYLLAGASWVGEYGDPAEPKIHKAISKYSPYQNLQVAKKYPEVFFMTSMADDRVHPGHARRMAHKMETMGHPYLYYENIEGGHGGSANLKQQAYWWALQYTYFKQKLMY